MTAKEILDMIRREKDTPGRFPCRLIFVDSYPEYASLVGELIKECEVTLDLASYGKGDLIPDFRALKRDLKKHVDKRVVLLSMGEYLRLCSKRERNRQSSVFPGFWTAMQAEHATTKYIVPLFCGKELFDQIVPSIDERQQDFLWSVTDANELMEYTIRVFSPDFGKAVQADASSMQEWLSEWGNLFSHPERREFSVISKLVKYAEATIGNVSVKVIDEPFKYVVSLVSDGARLAKKWGDRDFWASVIPHVKCDEPFEVTIKGALNLGEEFDPVLTLAVFRYLTDAQRRLLWIWYQLHPDDEYCSYAIRLAKTPEEIPAKLRDAIFGWPGVTEKRLEERRKVLKALDMSYNSEYFSKLGRVFPAQDRFSYLTYKSCEEQTYAIKTVSELLRKGESVSAIADQLRNCYPDLAEYLVPSGEDTGEVCQYFNWYRRAKIINRPPKEWPNYIDFERLDSRNKHLQKYQDTFSLWIDGLGAEWLPLLVKRLKQLNVVTEVSATVGRAILPTETEFNRKWKAADEKWDRLDKLSHDGTPDDDDYYRCIARQLEIIGQIVMRVSELLIQHDQIMITGDHGSSRLAALMFHVPENFALVTPKNSVVRSFGRFCELESRSQGAISDSMESVTVDHRHFLVMRTYEHFKQSGNAAAGNTDERAVAGEIHGGMTPEEYLVPVIFVKGKLSSGASNRVEPQERKAAVVNEMGI